MPPPIPPFRLHGKQAFPGQPPIPRVQIGDHGSEYAPSSGPAEAAGGENVEEIRDEIEKLFEEEFGENPQKEELVGNPEVARGSGEVSGASGQASSGVGVKSLGGEKEFRTMEADKLESLLLQEHVMVSSLLEDTLNQVPVGNCEGAWYGVEIQTLMGRRSEVEGMLEEARRCRDHDVIRLCGLNVDETTPEVVLQTTVVSLEEVRKNIGEWRAAMEKEYRSLTEETQAIEPISVGDLDEREIEYVPGKLVCTLKAGPNGGRKKCRGVICGNLLDEAVDPAPWGSYASGADGLLIRATLKHGVQKGWGITTTDVKTAFLLAPRPKPEGAREVIVIPPKIMERSMVFLLPQPGGRCIVMVC